LVVVEAATSLGSFGGGAAVGRRDRFARFACRRGAGTPSWFGGRHRWLLGLPRCAGPTGTFGDRFDDLGVGWPGVP
jgi:hypothetical protein